METSNPKAMNPNEQALGETLALLCVIVRDLTVAHDKTIESLGASTGGLRPGTLLSEAKGHVSVAERDLTAAQRKLNALGFRINPL